MNLSSMVGTAIKLLAFLRLGFGGIIAVDLLFMLIDYQKKFDNGNEATLKYQIYARQGRVGRLYQYQYSNNN